MSPSVPSPSYHFHSSSLLDSDRIPALGSEAKLTNLKERKPEYQQSAIMTPSPNFQSRILFKNLGQHSELEIKLELEQEPKLQLELELHSELEPAQSELE